MSSCYNHENQANRGALDAKIEAWQKNGGIMPAQHLHRDALDDLAAQALRLIQIVTLERSGIRDGDGFWHGSDPLAGTVDRINELLGQRESGLHADAQERRSLHESDGLPF
jgi:hypothetical protein